jgi:hypothetical protein
MPPEPEPAFMLPLRPARIWVMKSLAAPGELGRKTVLLPCLVPMSLRVSKYCVSSTSAMTSDGVAPGTDSRKFSMEARSPSMMAWRSAAMPLPWRAFDSASASACLTLRIFSASPRAWAATWARWAALMSFIASLTLESGMMSVTSAVRML